MCHKVSCKSRTSPGQESGFYISEVESSPLKKNSTPANVLSLIGVFDIDHKWSQTIEFLGDLIWCALQLYDLYSNCNCWNPLYCTHIPSSLSRHDAVLNKPTWREQKTPRDEKQNQGTHLQPYCSDEKHHRHKDVLKDVHPSVRTSQKKKWRMDRP